MVEIYDGKDCFVHDSAESLLSSDSSHRSEAAAKKREQKLKNLFSGHPSFRNIQFSQNGKNGLSLCSKSDFEVGDLVFSEPPLAAYTTNGFCVFCGAIHLEMADQMTSLKYLDQNGTKASLPLRPSCKMARKMAKAASPVLNYMEIDEDTFSSIDKRKVHLALHLIFSIYSQNRKTKSATEKNKADLGENIFLLHSECSCESLKTEERRYAASEKLKELLPKKYTKNLSTEELSEVFSIIDTNSFELNLDSSFGGCALYLLGSLINHSCAPNCYFVFDEKTLSLEIVANGRLSAGDELSIAYDSYAVTLEENFDRILYISQNLGFVCRCIKCAPSFSLLCLKPDAYSIVTYT